MSRFFSERFSALTPYTPGEQPKDQQYIKLNTNESPFPPIPAVAEAAEAAARTLHLYPDPNCGDLTAAVAKLCGAEPDEVLLTNGSDEILYFAFMAFCDEKHPAVFADLTYGFYPVYAKINNVPYRTIPLREDFTLNVEDYRVNGSTIFIANPNAPTGIAVSVAEIEQVLTANPDSVVVVDEAYVDFGGESCVALIHKYDNLLVTRTFSKSRSMAGARLGFGVGCRSLIRDLNTIKYSTNPYNLDRMTLAAGLASLQHDEVNLANCRAVMATRERTAKALRALGFTLTDSSTNFLFAAHPKLDGGELYRKLKARGILVRHFDQPRIANYNRITVGSDAQMDALLQAITAILAEQA